MESAPGGSEEEDGELSPILRRRLEEPGALDESSLWVSKSFSQSVLQVQAIAVFVGGTDYDVVEDVCVGDHLVKGCHQLVKRRFYQLLFRDVSTGTELVKYPPYERMELFKCGQTRQTIVPDAQFGSRAKGNSLRVSINNHTSGNAKQVFQLLFRADDDTVVAHSVPFMIKSESKNKRDRRIKAFKEPERKKRKHGSDVLEKIEKRLARIERMLASMLPPVNVDPTNQRLFLSESSIHNEQ